MNKPNGFESLFHRHAQNPILSAADWPYPVHTVFNAGATRLSDGTTLLLCRVEDRRGHSHLCAARSADGVSDWVIDTEPTFRPDPERYPEELWGVEDPRITYVEELERYAIAYTAFSRGGRFALIHRPVTDSGAHIWISYSPDLVNWGGHRLVLQARRGAWWDANKIGLSPPLIETPRGWLMIYHGVRQTASGALYRIGVALLDRERPEHCLLRGESWIFGPEAAYETHGDVSHVVFPCGTTLDDDGDTLHVYYGAADTSIALARGSVRALLHWLDRNGHADAGPHSGEPQVTEAPPTLLAR